MPLRNINDIPKIPKSHKKDSEKVKKKAPALKEEAIEYRITLYFHFLSIEKKEVLRIHIETVKEFTGLIYTLNIGMKRKKDTFDISLLGLSATQMYPRNPQPATIDIDIEAIFGINTINLIKQDGSINSTELEVNPYNKKLVIIREYLPEKTNNRLFSTMAVDSSRFSFAEEK